MAFTLTYQKAYKSIHRLPTTVYPDFMLVTGPNGAGKSHLLEAIETGAIELQADSKVLTAKRFDFNTMVPNRATTATPGAFYHRRDQILSKVEAGRGKYSELVQRTCIEFNLEEIFEECRRMGTEWDLDSKLEQYIPDTEARTRAKSQCDSAKKQATDEFLRLLRRDKELSKYFEKLPTEVKSNPLQITENSLPDFGVSWGTTNLFQQSFAELFLGYHELVKQNKLLQLDQEDGLAVEALSDQQFREKYGPPPWHFVNESLVAAGLTFKIDHPSGYSQSKYTPQLTQTDTGALLDFNSLSSGEKILMSFAFCIYYSQKDDQISKPPDILLFDEIDAPLHPSMSKVLVDTIINVLVQTFGVKVIMTTHSPATVAMAPPEALFSMSATEKLPKRIGQAAAIRSLTVGVPLLSVTYGEIHPVFVESTSDAKWLASVYDLLKGQEGLEMPLGFIGMGKRVPGTGDVGGGCGAVRDIVSKLVNAGNGYCAGLVDWDLTSTSQGRIRVMSESTRYSIENWALDPLIVLASLLGEDPSTSLFSLAGVRRTDQLLAQAEGVLQNQVRELTICVLGQVGDEVSISYGLSSTAQLKVSKLWLECQGHELESKVRSAVPAFRRFHQPGLLTNHAVTVVLSQWPELIPLDVIQSFRELVLELGRDNTPKWN